MIFVERRFAHPLNAVWDVLSSPELWEITRLGRRITVGTKALHRIWPILGTRYSGHYETEVTLVSPPETMTLIVHALAKTGPHYRMIVDLKLTERNDETLAKFIVAGVHPPSAGDRLQMRMCCGRLDEGLSTAAQVLMLGSTGSCLGLGDLAV